MPTPTDAVLMARYNRWMNERLYASATELDDRALSVDRGAFFKSILGTLNHLFVTDVLWLARFAGHGRRFEALEGLPALPQGCALDTVVHDDLESLTTARTALDERILEFAGELTADDLASDLDYANSKGMRFRNGLGELLLHFFNHQTHHRAQVTTLLSQSGVDVGVTDLVALIRE